MEKKGKPDDPIFSAYTVSQGSSPIHYRLIRLKMKGKSLDGVDIIMEEILPVVIAKVDQLLREERMH